MICEVETEKAVFEVEAPGAGFLRKIIVGDGEETPIFSVIGYVGTLEEEIPSVKAVAPRHDDAHAVVPASPRKATTPPPKRGDRLVVSPRAKRLAEEKGVPIEQVKGSGAKGRITEKDVRAYLEAQKEKTVVEEVRGGRVVPMSKIRKVTARKMRQSKQTVPHFYVTLSVDMTGALDFLAQFNQSLEDPEQDSISLTDLVARACVLAFKEHPELNSSVLDEDRIVLWEDLNIGLAVAVDSDLVVPVMAQVEELSLIEIARARRHLIEKAKEGKQASLAPARFTISNMGMFNVDNFLAIINPPETAILAVSSVTKRPVALGEGQVGMRDMLNLSLSIDHRVADGVLACRFLNAIKAALENPETLG